MSARARPERNRTSRLCAERPPGYQSRGATGWKGSAIRATVALNRALYAAPGARWWRRRLDAALRVRCVDVTLGRGGRDLDGLRIAFLSDLHAGAFMMGADLCRLFERVSRLEPDVIALGGDLVDSHADELLVLGKALPLLAARLGVFAVPGNHDHYADPDLDLWRSCLEEHGVTTLLNEGVRLACGDASFWLGGIDDLSQGEPDLDAALGDAREDEPVVLLAHHPDFFVESASAGVDLTLSGHTHGGQVALFGRPPFFLRHSRHGWWQGRFQRDGAQLYVGAGAGTTLLPLRIRAPGEIPLLRLLAG